MASDLLGTASGPFDAGAVVDVDEATGKSWVKSGAAVQADDDPADDGLPSTNDNKSVWVDAAEELEVDVAGMNKPDVIEAVRQAAGQDG